ncbi:uncharacterized protein [Cherax quadricarinatus]|nr:uncharacterized protein LOC128695437 isoform X2 [Cherax quadricarinatus]
MRVFTVAATVALLLAVPECHAQRPQFLDVAPFSHGLLRRPPSPRLRGSPSPPVGSKGPPLLPHPSGPLFHGPPTKESFEPYGPQFSPEHGTGHLPLDPRPNFDNPHFQPVDVRLPADEEALEGGDFSQLFSEESALPGRDSAAPGQDSAAFGQDSPAPGREDSKQHLPSEHLRPPAEQQLDDFSSLKQSSESHNDLHHLDSQDQDARPSQEEYPAGVTEEIIPQVTPQQEEESQLQHPPRHSLKQKETQAQGSRTGERTRQRLQEPPQQLGPKQYEQETQKVEVVSAPRHNSHSTSQPHRRPSHPNQLPLYNVIDHAMEVAESQEQPYRILYDYSEEEEEEKEEEEEEEEEEPDRLSVLLLSSHFSCVDKKNGYYADEEVDCEVFHYCQDRVKHSWLCPQGASFHQVHLICIPRSEDNICERSSKFHFVNEFLYKEVDGESGTNKTYADRYYPEGFEHGVAGVDPDRGVASPAAVASPSPQQHHQQKHRPTHAYLDSLPHTRPQYQQYQEDAADYYVDTHVEQVSRPHNVRVPQGFSSQPAYVSGTSNQSAYVSGASNQPAYRGGTSNPPAYRSEVSNPQIYSGGASGPQVYRDGGQELSNIEEVLTHRRPG